MLSPDLSFVLEDSEGVCGYVVGVLDSQKFYEQLIREWLPSLSSKYSSEGCKLMNGTEQVWYHGGVMEPWGGVMVPRGGGGVLWYLGDVMVHRGVILH